MYINFSIFSKLNEWLIQNSVFSPDATLPSVIILAVAAILFSYISYWIGKKILIRVLHHFAKITPTRWDDVLMNKRFFHRLAWIPPILILYFFSPAVFPEYPTVVEIIKSFFIIILIIVLLSVSSSFFNAVQDIYTDFKMAKRRPINVYIQFIKILVFTIGIAIIMSIIFPKFYDVLTGLGIMSVIIMLIFKDTILGFVGGIQLSLNEMIRPGDWITMPKFNVDGIVQEINLLTVKVQNFDKTISTIPTYTMVSESFQNWYGMEEAGGRRIKRSVFIDMNSVKFCDDKMLKKFYKINLLHDYLNKKEIEINEYNKDDDVDNETIINARRQTNLGVFRAYIDAYLRKREDVRNDLTFLIRHLEPTDKGIPIQIYVFTNTTKWAMYEKIQADIFDHIISVIPEFDLNVFQSPSGNDFKRFSENIAK